MTLSQQVTQIIIKEFRQDKWMVLWTSVFMLYAGASFGLMLKTAFQQTAPLPFYDIWLMIFTPMLGFYLSRRAFKYLSEDSYTQMLYFYKSLPIPLEAVVLSRGILGLLAFIFNGVIFFGAVYLLPGDGVKDYVSLSAYILFSITWIGFGLMVYGMYIYLEFMKSGKRYFWMTMAVVGAFVLVLIGIQTAGLRFSLIHRIMASSQEYGLMTPWLYITVLTGLVSYGCALRLTCRRMKKRDLM
ncbi:hypothetical protein ACH6EH_02595 [Paenibacillus sp. JSM ZJ436]|uniref:hypothetical protein n=1 Tax=Paenibacillus sp. JSM ZJ436 TaxID=3376190 RepID=UPI0037B6C7E3